MKMIRDRNVIETRDLTKRFNSFTAVNKVNMHVREGEIYGLLGPNGAGKSTIIRMLTTLSRPTKGSATVGGFDIVKEAEKVRQNVGIVAEKLIMYDRLTAYENLRLFSKLYNVPKKEMEERIEELLKIVNMTKWADTQIGKFSTGMKQRINVIRALVNYPRIVFMDEPTLGRDPQSTTDIRDLIRKLNEERGLTIVLTTHIMNEADVLCDRLGLIDRGVINVVGTPSELKSRITEKGSTVIDLDLSDPPPDAYEKYRDLKFVKGASQDENRIRLIATSENAFQDMVDASRRFGFRLRNANVNQPSLEDVFLHYTGRSMVEEVKDKVPMQRGHGPMGKVKNRVR